MSVSDPAAFRVIFYGKLERLTRAARHFRSVKVRYEVHESYENLQEVRG